MQKKLIGYLIIVVAVLILIGIIYIIFFHKFSGPISVDNTKPQTQNTIEKIPEIIKNTEEKKIEIRNTPTPGKLIDSTETTVKKLAASFAERFGSYSNQSNYTNLEESLLFMSDKMRAREENNLASLRAKKLDSSNYSAIVTKVITCQITHLGGDVAEASIGALKTEISSNDSEKKSYSQNAIVKLVKVNNEWKIDEFIWQ